MSDEGPPAVSSPSLFEIERTSKEFQLLASAVVDRLKAFDSWLNALPGKTEVSVTRSNNKGERHYLALQRDKDRWGLFFSPADEDGIYAVEQISLANKCIAVSMLPDLLQSLHDEQLAAVERMKEAADVFAQLPSAKGGK